MKDQESRVIHAFSRNSNEKVQLSVRRFRGQYYIDMRVWFSAEKPDILKPTRKGLSVKLSDLPAFHEGLSKVIAFCENDLVDDEMAHE